MTTREPIPPPPESGVQLRPSPLDHRRPSPTVPRMDPPAKDAQNERQRALLRAQPWGRILAQLTGIALKRIRGRSLGEAKDLAQSAIAGAYETIEGGGWDPEKGPLLSFLVARVISAAQNERRRKRNVCEVWLDEEHAEDEGLRRHEKHLGDGKPDPEEALERLRFASTFHDRLVARLAGDGIALAVITLMKQDVSTPLELAKATGRSFEEAKGALRRIRYHATEITRELSTSNVIPLTRARPNEVLQ
jgi:DNA-directed RNA polymerase specialized sigma24 family protein